MTRRRPEESSKLWEKAVVVLAVSGGLVGGEAIRTGHTSVGSALGFVLLLTAMWVTLSLAGAALRRRADRNRR
jgi:hypothetical protein